MKTQLFEDAGKDFIKTRMHHISLAIHEKLIELSNDAKCRQLEAKTIEDKEFFRGQSAAIEQIVILLANFEV